MVYQVLIDVNFNFVSLYSHFLLDPSGVVG